MNFKNCLLDNVTNKFYFGIGGIGDFLLLISTFYDNITPLTDVVFVCNNTNIIREVSKTFDKVCNWWFYPRQAFVANSAMWETITSMENCVGTGVTPKGFDYIKDWIKCGDSSVFAYYGVNKSPMWASPVKHPKEFVMIQPYGGDNDATKIKEIPKEQVLRLVDTYHNRDIDVYLIGSDADKKKFGELEDLWVTDIKSAIHYIKRAQQFIGTDSWGKTLAGLAGIQTVVYKNKYNGSLNDIFGYHVDPGNYVFLYGWDFLIV